MPTGIPTALPCRIHQTEPRITVLGKRYYVTCNDLKCREEISGKSKANAVRNWNRKQKKERT